MVFEARRIAFDAKEYNLKKDPEKGYFDLKDFMNMFSATNFRPNSFSEVIQNLQKVKMGDNYLGKMVIREEYNNSISYHEVYIGEENDNLFLFSASYPEIYYSIDNKATFQKIVSGIKFGKQE